MKDLKNSENDRIASLAECRKILNRNGNNYTDEQILKIRDYLIVLAEMQYKHYKSKQDETGNLIRESLNR